MTDKLQRQRFEHKYLINEHTALLAREFVRSYLDVDENGFDKPNFSYPVHSLYLDNEKLQLFHETINGTKNRYKLRLRYYGIDAQSPIYFEIKRRLNNCILKQRGAVLPSAVELLLNGELPDLSHMASKDPKQFAAVQNFCELMNKSEARPQAHIFYLREAYLSPDGEVRVTMDRNVLGDANPEPRIKTEMRHPVSAFKNEVILELKFTNRFPRWFNDLVRVCNVMQCGAAKYVESMSLIRPAELRPPLSTADRS
jgi:hypothetical protein